MVPVEGEWGSSRLAGRMLENTFGAEFFVPNALNCLASARGGKVLLSSLFGKRTNVLGAMMLRSGGRVASGKIPLQ